MLFSAFTPALCAIFALAIDDPVAKPIGAQPTGVDEPVTTRAGKELRLFELGGLVQRLSNDPRPSIHLARGMNRESHHMSVVDTLSSQGFGEIDRRPLEVDVVMDWLRNTVQPESWDQEGVQMSSRASKLVVIQEPAVLDEVARQLTNLRLAIAPRLRVRCVAWRPPEASESMAPTRLTVNATKELLRSVASGSLGDVVHDASTVCRSGGRVRLGVSEWLDYQPDVEAEVAEKASIRDPKVEALALGRDFWLQPVVGPQQRGIVVTGIVRDRQIAELERRTLTELGPVSLEAARVDQATSAYSVWLEDGGAYRQSVGELETLVCVERVDPLPQFPDSVRVIPSGFFYTDNLGRMFFHGENESIGSGSMDLDEIQELIRNVAQIGDEEGELVSASGWSLAMTGPVEKLNLADRVLDSLTRPALRNFVVELRTEYDAGGDGAGDWIPLGSPVHVSCMTGKVGVAIDGSQQDYLRDSQVEIASQEVINDPVPSSIFTGTQFFASVQPIDDELSVQFVAFSRSMLELRKTPPAAPSNNAIDCPHISQTSFSRTLRVPAGQVQSLGEGPRRSIDGKIRRTRMTLVVRELR